LDSHSYHKSACQTQLRLRWTTPNPNIRWGTKYTTQERQPTTRYRNKQVILRLNDVEKSKLDRKAAKAKLTKSAYLRHLIDGVTPKEAPPHDYYQMMKQLYAIGNNLNQLAHAANATGQMDDATIKDTLAQVRSAIVNITDEIVAPAQKGA
jgi:hypothetical protein